MSDAKETNTESKLNVYHGQCPCGAVQFELTIDKQEDLTQMYCHCADCRRWHSAPFVSEVVTPTGAAKIIKGAEYTAIHRQTPTGCYRKICTQCGTRLMTGFGPDIPFEGFFPSLFPTFPFTPSCHLHYSERIVSVKDGLTKYKKSPPEFGGDCPDVLPE